MCTGIGANMRIGNSVDERFCLWGHGAEEEVAPRIDGLYGYGLHRYGLGSYGLHSYGP